MITLCVRFSDPKVSTVLWKSDTLTVSQTPRYDTIWNVNFRIRELIDYLASLKTGVKIIHKQLRAARISIIQILSNSN